MDGTGQDLVRPSHPSRACKGIDSSSEVYREREGGDDTSALQILTHAAEAGSHDAHWQLGDIREHVTRFGITKDVTAAQEWFRRASKGDNGLPRSKFRLVKLLLIKQGVIYSTDSDNPAVPEAKELLNDAAAAGDHEAQFRLAQAYEKGEPWLFDMGSTTDDDGIGTTHAGRIKLAIELYEKLVSASVAKAKVSLAELILSS